MSQEIIGTKDGQNYFVGSNAPAATAPPPPTAPITRYQTPTTPTTTDTGTTGSDFTLKTPEQLAAERNGGVDENAIREQTRQAMQSQIDATNSYYADLVSKREQTNQGLLGSTRAINARSGLAGSDFGKANMDGQQTANDQAIKAIRDEQNLKIAEINGKISQAAKEEIAARKQEALGNADAYNTYLQGQQAKATASIKSLGESGTTVEDLKTHSPQTLDYLRKVLGMTDFQIQQSLSSAAGDKLKTDTKIVGNTAYASVYNPITGKFETHVQKFDAPDGSLVDFGGGKIMVANIDPTTGKTTYTDAEPAKPQVVGEGGALVDATGKVLFKNPKTTTSGGTGGINGASNELLSAINNGTIDPNKINSRTLGIYNQIAKAQVDAVQSHAGSNAKTKAYEDTYGIKTTASRLIGTIDKNLPLVANLADKVNITGVPGLDSYLSGAKAYTGNDPNVGKYINSLTTLRTEYANMLAKGATPTESQRAEASQAIPAGKNGAFYTALGEQLKLEGQNIISAADDTLNGIFNNQSGDTSSTSGGGNINALRQKYNY